MHNNNQRFNLTYLEELNEIIRDNECFQYIERTKTNKKNEKLYTYQYMNRLFTCIIRIRETVEYLDKFKFRKNGAERQAFDFYEFVNCISIIDGCVKILFEVLSPNQKNYYPENERVFKASNKTKSNDHDFFSFVRSASSVHPAETDRHKKTIGKNAEFYPYCEWLDPNCLGPLGEVPEGSDIVMRGWGCKTKQATTYYYLSTDEFYDYVSVLLDTIKDLIPKAEEIAEQYNEKLNYKRLKKPENFKDFSEYCLYLRTQLKKKNRSEEFIDGGLLLASHILTNERISEEFKSYIRAYVRKIEIKMRTAIRSIEFNEIFDNLHLSSILTVSNKNYIELVFNNDLFNAAFYLIELMNNLTDLKSPSEVTQQQMECKYAIDLLKMGNNPEINKIIDKKRNYADLYESILDLIFTNDKNPKI